MRKREGMGDFCCVWMRERRDYALFWRKSLFFEKKWFFCKNFKNFVNFFKKELT
jgi:hypothetical protein